MFVRARKSLILHGNHRISAELTRALIKYGKRCIAIGSPNSIER